MTAATAALRLAPGAGLVCRHPSALLFVTAPDRALVDAFASSACGAELQALASATVAAGFDVAPFVGVSWHDGLRVMAFGDIAVETDQPSLPMLSGAGSRTWVEHGLADVERAVVEVAGADVDELTDLGAGIVTAGGFRLELGGRSTTDAAPPADVADVGPSDATAVVGRVEPAPSPAAAPSAPEPVGVDEGLGHDPDVTLPPPASELLLAEVRDADLDERGSLVDAKLCRNGDANAPTAATCAVCGDFLPPGTAAVVHVPRPSLGRLQLDDGELIELDQELLIGRNPDRDDEPSRARMRRVKTPGEKVSRSHLEVRFQGWDILVEDCGSTNGTFVVAHHGGQVVPLEPGRAQLVEPGAVVYFGSRSMTVLGRARR